MANHVTTWIEVQSDKEEVYQSLVDMFRGSTYNEHGDTMWWYRKLYNLDENAEYDRGDYTDRMGAKWCYIDDVAPDEMFFEMTTTSAWDFCDGAIMQLHSILSEIDEDVLIRFTYEDESLSPIGGGGVFRGEMEHYSEDWSEKWPDPEDEDYDEKYDSIWDSVYDTKSELMIEACDDLMSQMSEDEIEQSEENDEE